MDPSYPRDLKGYGPNPPDPKWPNGARLALSFVVNYEEGGEHSVLHGDSESEVRLTDMGGPTVRHGVRDMQVESMFEYGSRRGYWQLLKLFQARNIPITVFAVGMAAERNPETIHAAVEAGHEITPHGWRWIDYQHVAESVERDHIRRCVNLFKTLTGEHPPGWYTGRMSPNTRRLVVEEGGFLYDSDSYNDDLPFWETVGGKPFLVLPYVNDLNDLRLAPGNGLGTGDEFFSYMKDAFDWLHKSPDAMPGMLTVGVHCRIVARPARVGGLARFLDYVQSQKNVWICRRIDIARHWMKHHPYRG